MNDSVAEIKIKARSVSGILWEDYTYTAGMIEPVPKHCHDTYQLCLSFDSGWRYVCNGQTVPISDGVLSLINAEDPHAIEAKRMQHPTSFSVVYLESKAVQDWATQLSEKSISQPRFETTLTAKQTLKAFQKFWHTHAAISYELERDAAKFEFLNSLLVAHSLSQVALKVTRRTGSSLKKVRDYLADNLTENVPTQTLSELSGLEPTYLIRAFRQTFGVSPHQFHLQRRIEFGKTLLLKQLPLSQVAHEIGFFDQSHFGLHFRRLVGVSPQKYRC